MRCPRDGSEMLHEVHGGVAVDLCPACGGAWFDRFELDRVDDAADEGGRALVERLAELGGPDAPAATDGARLASPVDPSVVMMRRFADPEGAIEIDECPVSGGIWLDAGELAAIRRRFPDAAAREEAARLVIERVMSCPDFHAARAREHAEAARTNRVARLLRWIVPFTRAA